MQMRKFLNPLLLCLLLLAGLPVASQQALERQSFLLTFIPNIQFAPIYVTIAEGHFAEIGLDVTLEYLNEPDVVDLIAAGQAQFGVVSGEQVILSVAQQRPILYVYEWFQKFPVGVVVPADSDIQTPADLAGLRVGVPGRFGASYSGLVALLRANGMSESDVDLREIGFAAPEVFCLGQVDAATIYITNEPLQIRNLAEAGDCGEITEVRVLPISDYSSLISNGIITNQALVENNPERVQGFVTAFDAGLRSTINNPARAYLLSRQFVETLPLSADFEASLTALADAQDEFLVTAPDAAALAENRETMLETLRQEFDSATLLQFEVLLESIKLWETDEYGLSDPESWAVMQETLLALDKLANPIALENAFSNEFAPQGAAE